MAETKRRYNPQPNRPQDKKKKMDKVLNGLIGVVVLLILVVATMIILGDKSDDKDTAKETDKMQQEKPVIKQPAEEEEDESDEPEEPTDTEDNDEENDNVDDNNVDDSTSTEEDTESNNSVDQTQTDSNTSTDNNSNSSEDKTNSSTAKKEDSDDPIVKEVIKDSNWKPTATAQKESGAQHNSSYDSNSTDWKEKVATLASTTGLNEDEMIVWYLKNGGSPDTAIGTVSSKDKKDKYRVYMKWVKNKGWKPTKMEVLNTLPNTN
ncbi:YrrS family protein [Viridibacillus sp. FSL E2-0187]|uniref:YrrS family protein n=1 Tax=Viridibacillus TaxID=496496 RepID=UPI00187B2250|nr:YrrS family protein [Viridibacillus sp. JNUCC-6]QOV12780.1 YrrS family protein [Viridibacillus sp. JNUCC-6]